MSIIVMLGLAACSPVLDWRDTQFAEADGLQALFPCKPDRLTRRVRLVGEAVTFALASCSAGSLTFALGHVELVDAGQAAAALDELQSTAAANVGGAIQEVPGARVAGAAVSPRVRQIVLLGRRPDGGRLQEAAILFAKGRRVFQASVVGEAIDAAAVETFFSGLKLPG